MDLQSFSSIFELFATFALAYIVIDELQPNPFIATMTEKILRKYKLIERWFDEIRRDIKGVRNSIDEIAQWENQPDDLKQRYSRYETKLKSTETRCENSYQETRIIVQGNYRTKVFSYVNCYLFFYCLILLFYGGVYSSNDWANVDQVNGKVFKARIDSSLALFVIFSYLFIIVAWKVDKNREENDSPGFVEQLYRGDVFNGYVLAFILSLIGCVLGLLSFFLHWSIVPLSETAHNTLMIFCILLPVTNFIAYIIKASWRANTCMPRVKDIATKYKNDYKSELEPVQKYIGACGLAQMEGLEIAANQVPKPTEEK